MCATTPRESTSLTPTTLRVLPLPLLSPPHSTISPKHPLNRNSPLFNPQLPDHRPFKHKSRHSAHLGCHDVAILGLLARVPARVGLEDRHRGLHRDGGSEALYGAPATLRLAGRFACGQSPGVLITTCDTIQAGDASVLDPLNVNNDIG